MAVSYALNAQSSYKSKSANILQLQKRIAEITEMIHTASLFHDDVIDKAVTRRGSPTVNQVIHVVRFTFHVGLNYSSCKI